jgi:hypothetical protein
MVVRILSKVVQHAGAFFETPICDKKGRGTFELEEMEPYRSDEAESSIESKSGPAGTFAADFDPVDDPDNALDRAMSMCWIQIRAGRSQHPLLDGC